MELKATEQRYELYDESGYVFEVVATFDPEWGWAASVVMTKRGMRTAEAAIEGLGSLAAQFLRMLNGDEEGERDRLRAQVEELRGEDVRWQERLRTLGDLADEQIKAAHANIAEQARRIESLQESCDIRGAALERAEAAGQQIGHRHARLEQALNMYGAHLIGCDFRRASAAMSGMDCTCGFIDARDAALKEQAAPEDDDEFTASGPKSSEPAIKAIKQAAPGITVTRVMLTNEQRAGLSTGGARIRGEPCECDLRYRRWNPNTGRCETCRRRYEAGR